MRETRRNTYQCQKLGGVAMVQLTYVVKKDPPIEVLSKFDCENRGECGVATRDGLTWSFDWLQCVHPDSPKS